MYTVTTKSTANKPYYNLTFLSKDNSHYLNIYISEVDNAIWITISKSDDGFYFKSPCDESSDLQIDSSKSLEETNDYVKEHFLSKGYKLSKF